MYILPELLLEAIASKAAFAPDGTTRPLESNVSREEAEALYLAIRSIQPTNSLEIGLAHGISALAILGAIAANGAGHHYVIDPFQQNYANCGEAMITLAGFAERHTFLEHFPEEVIPQLPRLQFALIDASHLFDLTVMEFALIDKKLDIGGIVALHDLWMPSQQAVVRFILANRSYETYRNFSTAEPQLSIQAHCKELISKVLRKMPGANQIFGSNVLHPWSTFRVRNLVFLRKFADDHRDWRFHQRF
jgi:predicted O-methyltransferase YrrM